MTGELMIYGTEIALMVSLAAWVVERVAGWRGTSRRAAWAGALLLSFALPVVGLLMPKPRAEPVTYAATPSFSISTLPSSTTGSAQKSESTAPDVIATAQQVQRNHRDWINRDTIDQAAFRGWLLASLALAVFYTLGALRLRSAARHWKRDEVDGQTVWITESLGPAVCGVLRPMILLPRWVLDSPRQVRALVLAHEQEHIAARDPVLLGLAWLLVVIAPWNLPLWWQLKRLRFAMEVDCDARVLRRGEKAVNYGEVLLAVGQHRTVMPVGAIALTEPASQLLRRIRIMTTQLPRRGKLSAAAAIALSMASLGVATEFRAPAIRIHETSLQTSDNTLRKLPPREDPRDAAVEKLVRSTYPELFGPSAPSTPVLVSLMLNPDGTLYKSIKEDIEPTPWIAVSLRPLNEAGIDFERSGSPKLRLKGSSVAHNYVDVGVWYRAPPADPARDVATVRAKVKERYASLFRPTYADGAREIREGRSVLTVFMTENGEIDRAQASTTEEATADEDMDADVKQLTTPEHFAAMGIPPNRLGPIGTTQLYEGRFLGERDMRTLLVVYAWPRRPNDPEANRESAAHSAAGNSDGPEIDRAIAERYFPDLYTHPKEWPRADPWVLLDRQGNVLTTGRRVAMSGRDFQLYVESLYPGIRTDGFEATTVHGGPGQSSDVGFLWLAADSPITDLSKADLSRRNALLLYADVIWKEMTRPTRLIALKVGSPSVIGCSLKDPFGVVHVEVTAVDAGATALTARVRIQHALLKSTEDEPEAVESAWSQESVPVRVPYGGSGNVKLTDQSGEAWTVVLHPERLVPERNGRT